MGKPLPPSAAIRVWYDRQLTDITNAMLAEYKEELTKAFEHPEVEIHYAQDAAANDFFQLVFRRLNKRWTDIFNGFASMLAPEFVEKVDTHSKSTTWFSLSAMGVKQPKTTYNRNVNSTIDNTLSASVEYNKTLITNIGDEIHKKLYQSIMLSVTSTVPERQGSSGIQNALKDFSDVLGKTKKEVKNRIDLITRDQTSKINASLSSERMKANGVEHFIWMHSGIEEAGHFRLSHQKMNGEIFKVDDPRLWQVGGPYGLKKGDLGPPGWAINCRCRAKPVISFDDED